MVFESIAKWNDKRLAKKAQNKLEYHKKQIASIGHHHNGLSEQYTQRQLQKQLDQCLKEIALLKTHNTKQDAQVGKCDAEIIRLKNRNTKWEEDISWWAIEKCTADVALLKMNGKESEKRVAKSDKRDSQIENLNNEIDQLKLRNAQQYKINNKLEDEIDKLKKHKEELAKHFTKTDKHDTIIEYLKDETSQLKARNAHQYKLNNKLDADITQIKKHSTETYMRQCKTEERLHALERRIVNDDEDKNECP